MPPVSRVAADLACPRPETPSALHPAADPPGPRQTRRIFRDSSIIPSQFPGSFQIAHSQIANGLPAETFLPRAYGLASLEEEDRLTLLAQVPALADDPATGYGPPARPLLSMQQLATLPAAALTCPMAPLARAA